MLSRKSKDKTIKEGVVGKYVKKETPPEIPSEFEIDIIRRRNVAVKPLNKFDSISVVINVWTLDANKSKSKNRRNSQQLNGDPSLNTNENIIQATNQKFGNNGKIVAKNSGLGHEGKYTPK